MQWHSVVLQDVDRQFDYFIAYKRTYCQIRQACEWLICLDHLLYLDLKSFSKLDDCSPNNVQRHSGFFVRQRCHLLSESSATQHVVGIKKRVSGPIKSMTELWHDFQKKEPKRC
jgi:hypothetical protein